MEPDEYPHVFNEAKWAGYICMTFGLCCIWIGGYGAIHHTVGEGGIIAFWALGGVLLWQGRKIQTNKKPLLQLGPVGLCTPKLGFLPWKQIQAKIESVSGFNVGTVHYLVITRQKTREHLDSVALMSLGIAREEMEALLRKYTGS